MTIAVPACWNSKPPAPVEKLKSVGPPKAPAQTVAPPSASTVSAPAETNPLVGTTWTAGDLTLTFRDADTMLVKGGAVLAVAPNGLEVKYTLKGNDLEINALDKIKRGTFDGTKLVIEGKEAVKAQ